MFSFTGLPTLSWCWFPCWLQLPWSLLLHSSPAAWGRKEQVKLSNPLVFFLPLQPGIPAPWRLRMVYSEVSLFRKEVQLSWERYTACALNFREGRVEAVIFFNEKISVWFYTQETPFFVAGKEMDFDRHRAFRRGVLQVRDHLKSLLLGALFDLCYQCWLCTQCSRGSQSTRRHSSYSENVFHPAKPAGWSCLCLWPHLGAKQTQPQ